MTSKCTLAFCKSPRTFQAVHVFLSRRVLTIRVLACLFDSVEKCSCFVLFFVSMLINSVRLFRFTHHGGVASITTLFPLFEAPKLLTSGHISVERTKRTGLLFYLTAGRNVCTNKEGLKLIRATSQTQQHLTRGGLMCQIYLPL